MNNKIGVGIVTYNSENYFKELHKSLPHNIIDELVVVNGGNPYTEQYSCDKWIQHSVNKYPATCRNECVSYLLDKNVEHIFLIEDDMIIKNPDIFNAYINASNISGIKYFSFVSTSPGAGTPHNRSPRLIVEYENNVKISLYSNMCNEFTYHHRSAFLTTGLYDTQFRNPFDIDMAYRESQQSYATPFWWFADITNSDNYIINNPVAVSRLQAERNDGSREQIIQAEWDKFQNKHDVAVNYIYNHDKQYVINKLKNIKHNIK